MNSLPNQLLLRLHPELRCLRASDEQHSKLIALNMLLQQDLQKSNVVLSPYPNQALLPPPSLNIGLQTARRGLPPLIR